MTLGFTLPLEDPDGRGTGGKMNQIQWHGRRFRPTWRILECLMALACLFPLRAWCQAPALTEVQWQSLNALRAEFQKEMIELRKKIMVRRMELHTLSPEERRGEKGEALRGELRQLMTQTRERALFYEQEAMKLMTPEQWERFQAQPPPGFPCRGRVRYGRSGSAASGGEQATMTVGR